MKPVTTLPASAPDPRSAGGSGLKRPRAAVQAAILPVIIIAIWQLLDTFNLIPQALVPPPTSIVSTWLTWLLPTYGGAQFYSGHLGMDLATTVIRVAVGYGLAVSLGILAGLSIGWFPALDRLVSPTLQFLGPIPPVSWVPLSILWFGIGNRSAVFLTTLGSFFPIAVSTVLAVRGVNRNLIRAGTMMGARTPQLLRWIVLPAALPGILSGLRIGMGISWVMEITAEMLAVHSGLGYTLWNAYDFLNFSLVLAAMITIGVLGFLSDWVLRRLLARTLRWHQQMGLARQ